MAMKRTKRESSRVIVMFLAVLAIAVTVSTLVYVFKTDDSTPLIYLVPSVFTALSAGLGFYFWKARAENIYKYGEKFILDLADKVGSDGAVQIVQTFISSVSTIT